MTWLVATILNNAVLSHSPHLINWSLDPVIWLTGQPTKDLVSLSLSPFRMQCGGQVCLFSLASISCPAARAVELGKRINI